MDKYFIVFTRWCVWLSNQSFYVLYYNQEGQKRCSTVVIGYCIRGLVVYDVVNKDTRIPIHKLSWKQIENIVFKVIIILPIIIYYAFLSQQRRFELYITGSDEPLVYYVSSSKK